MRIIVTLLLLICINLLYGQNIEPKQYVYHNKKKCEVILGDTINCTDTLGQKQGFWKENCQIGRHHNGLRRCDGYYLNGQLESIWRTYSKNNLIESEVTYLNGNEIQIKVFKYNKDNQVIEITAYHRESGEIKTVYQLK